MESLKIAMLCWESMYSIRAGGMAPAVTDLAEAVARKGHEVHFFTRNAGQTSDEEINGVHYHRCSFDSGGNVVEYSYNMCRAILSRLHKAGRFDLVHGHDWHVVEALHELKDKYPTVLTFHSTEYGRNGNAFGDWWEFKEISAKEWYGSYIAKRITTVSHAMKNELIQLYRVPEWKIDVVPNGIVPERLRKNVDAGRVKERHGIHPLAPLVLFIGRLVRQKSPELLVEAVPHVLRHRGDVRFIVAGSGDMFDYLVRRANELGVSHAVKFLGYIPDEEYIQLLNACDIVAITSSNEPFGMVLLEAWSAGKAVVATDIGGLAENIDNFINGIKVFLYPESVAWGINYIINDAYGVKLLGENGRKKVEREFKWSAIAEKMERTYKNV